MNCFSSWRSVRISASTTISIAEFPFTTVFRNAPSSPSFTANRLRNGASPSFSTVGNTFVSTASCSPRLYTHTDFLTVEASSETPSWESSSAVPAVSRTSQPLCRSPKQIPAQSRSLFAVWSARETPGGPTRSASAAHAARVEKRPAVAQAHAVHRLRYSPAGIPPPRGSRRDSPTPSTRPPKNRCTRSRSREPRGGSTLRRCPGAPPRRSFPR